MKRRKRSQTRRYRLQYAEQARGHLAALRARDRVTVIERVEVQLGFEPTIETRSRKCMSENPLGAAWELGIGDLRVYCELDEPARVVNVIAVGIKDRDRVLIGGEEDEAVKVVDVVEATSSLSEHAQRNRREAVVVVRRGTRGSDIRSGLVSRCEPRHGATGPARPALQGVGCVRWPRAGRPLAEKR